MKGGIIILCLIPSQRLLVFRGVFADLVFTFLGLDRTGRGGKFVHSEAAGILKVHAQREKICVLAKRIAALRIRVHGHECP